MEKLLPRIDELSELLENVFVDIEKIILSESEDIGQDQKVNLSSSIGDFKREENSLQFRIGNTKYSIVGEILLFKESVYFRTYRNNEELSELSFLIKLKDLNPNDHVFYTKSGDSTFLGNGIKKFIGLLFEDTEKRNSSIYDTFTQEQKVHTINFR